MTFTKEEWDSIIERKNTPRTKEQRERIISIKHEDHCIVHFVQTEDVLTIDTHALRSLIKEYNTNSAIRNIIDTKYGIQAKPQDILHPIEAQQV